MGFKARERFMKDAWGNESSCFHPDAMEAVNHFIWQLLSLGKEAGQILKTAKTFDSVSLIQLYAALFFLYGQTEEAQKKAGEYLQKAKKLSRNDREKSFEKGLDLFQQFRISEALKILEEHMKRWPEDIAALKFTEFLYFCKGQEFEASRFLHTTEGCLAKLQQDPFFLSMYSFALELTGNLSKAKEMAQIAIEQQTYNPWAHHTLTHVYMKEGDIEPGIKLFEAYAPLWKHSSHLIESHNLWHLSLFYWENQQEDLALQVYERADWKYQAETIMEEIDAAALLWRLEMSGLDVTPYWKELAVSVQKQKNLGWIPFSSVQLLYTLQRAGETQRVQEHLQEISLWVSQQKEEEQKIWKQTGFPLMEGCIFFAQQNYQKTLDCLEPILLSIGCIGGSDAQVDLFHQCYLRSLIETKRFTQALTYLKTRKNKNRYTQREWSWMEECV